MFVKKKKDMKAKIFFSGCVSFHYKAQHPGEVGGGSGPLASIRQLQFLFIPCRDVICLFAWSFTWVH